MWIRLYSTGEKEREATKEAQENPIIQKENIPRYKMKIKNIDLCPLIHDLLIDNREWTVIDAIIELKYKYTIESKRYDAIASTYSRWKRNLKIPITDMHSLIKYISSENLKDFVKKHSEDKDFKYLDERYEHPRNPLGTDSRRILKAIRAMLIAEIKFN